MGRVCFHLAENKQDPEFPFAFMSTYVPRLGKNARAQHLPLNQALREYAGTNNKEALLRLLEPVYEAGNRCSWVKELLESGDIYHPMAWTPDEAYLLLKDLPLWKRAASLSVCRTGGRSDLVQRSRCRSALVLATTLSAQALLDFRVQLTLNGAELTRDEIAALTASSGGLAFVRGQWVEVDGEKLRQALDHWQKVQAEVR